MGETTTEVLDRARMEKEESGGPMKTCQAGREEARVREATSGDARMLPTHSGTCAW